VASLAGCLTGTLILSLGSSAGAATLLAEEISRRTRSYMILLRLGEISDLIC